MSGTETFGVAVLLAAVAGLAVLAASHLSERIKVPLPALVLVATAVAVKVVPGLNPLPQSTASQVVTVALVAVLFSGGMHIGRRRLRSAVSPIMVVGVVGTFGTAALAGVIMHLAFGLSWYVALVHKATNLEYSA